MKKIYIIRVNTRVIWFVEDTQEEFEKFLSRLNAKIIEIKNEGKTQRVRLETEAIGFDKDLAINLYREIADKLENVNQDVFSFRKNELSAIIKDVCRHAHIKSNAIDVLVENYTLHTTCTFSHLNQHFDEVCNVIEDYGGITIIRKEN